MAKESGLWKWLAKSRLDLREQLHLNRVENSVGAGMPDVEGFIVDANIIPAGSQFWLELKSEERPAKTTTPVRFAMKKRKHQIRWLIKRWNMGCNAYLLLQVGSGANRSIYLVPGDQAQNVCDGLTEEQLAKISAMVAHKKPNPSTFILAAAQGLIPLYPV